MSRTDLPDSDTVPGSRPGHGVAVTLSDLRRSYGSIHALDRLTLDIAPGEFVALLGPSCCGKTTALRVLAGLEDADSGRVEVGGKDIPPCRPAPVTWGWCSRPTTCSPT